MLDSLQASLSVASSGLEAQSTRMRIVSENLANANSTARAAGADPYQRKTVTFDAEMDRAAGAQLVKVKEVGSIRRRSAWNTSPGTPRPTRPATSSFRTST